MILLRQELAFAQVIQRLIVLDRILAAEDRDSERTGTA